MRLLLAISCQKDESADIDADGGQPSTEVSPRQLQNRAREIVNSEEYQAFVNQNRSFLSKINSKDFFTEDLIDEENETYNYDVINERLSMTSFESAEEFVREYEKIFYNTQKLVKKYPELANPSPGLKQKVKEMSFKKSTVEKQWNCVGHCEELWNRCTAEAEYWFSWAMIGCTCWAIANIPYGCTCAVIAMIDYQNAVESCQRSTDYCLDACNH